MENGGDFVTGLFPGNFYEITLKNRIKCDTIKKIWKQFCESGTTKFQGQAGGSTPQFNRMILSYYGFLKLLEPLRPRVNLISM